VISGNLIRMNTIIKQTCEIELHCLERRFEHVRVNNSALLNQLTTLIAQQGQQVPVIVVADEQPHCWILIDGYLRMSALKRLGQDTIQAEQWNCTIAEALLILMAHQQNRTFAALEEALVLQELQSQFGLSQAAIAKQIGRSKAWVSYRLQLLEGSSEKMLKAVREGAISTWVANRVFASFARANAQHADAFLDYLVKHHHSSRELHQFFEHYKTSPPHVRTKMVSEPSLFFQSRRALKREQEAQIFISGIEKSWLQPLQIMAKQLKQLYLEVDRFFYTGQPSSEEYVLLRAFELVREQFNLFENKLRGITHDKSTTPSNDSRLATNR
jgi:ParB family chromosome partitioning protein